MAKKVAKKEESKVESGAIKVVAVTVGYYGGKVRNEGDKFTVSDEKKLGIWMERLDGGKHPKREKHLSGLELSDEIEGEEGSEENEQFV